MALELLFSFLLFILKLFTQGTIQSKYCLQKLLTKLKSYTLYKIYSKNQRCIRLFFLEFGLEGID